MQNSHSSEINLKSLRESINAALADFSILQSKQIVAMGEELIPTTQALDKFVLDSGKRLRPLFALLGVMASGHEINSNLIKASTALEYLHVCALIHDDLMDESDSRRGAPSIHKFFESFHNENKLVGSASQYGMSAAVLIGDLALVLADVALHNSGISHESLIEANRIFDIMRVELMAGQFLDVHEQTLQHRSAERALRIATYKSGKYSIERPLHFGAALVEKGAKLDLINEALSNYGIPLGQAFQLRDDLLGVFGDSSQTGKPSGDDLKEGKRTYLIAQTLNMIADKQSENSADYQYLNSRLGNRDLNLAEVDAMKDIIEKSGGRDVVESTITQLSERAASALEHDSLDPVGVKALEEMIAVVTIRNT